MSATAELARLPAGTLAFEILSANLATVPDRPGREPRGVVGTLKFRATISWPRP